MVRERNDEGKSSETGRTVPPSEADDLILSSLRPPNHYSLTHSHSSGHFHQLFLIRRERNSYCDIL